MSTKTIPDTPAVGIRKETDSLGEVEVPSENLWGAQTQRSLEHFSIGKVKDVLKNWPQNDVRFICFTDVQRDGDSGSIRKRL